MARLKELDVVRTPKGNLGVVNKAGGTLGEVALALKRGADDKSAWWSPNELTYLFNVAEMVEVLDTDTIKELIRLRKGERNE